MNQESRKAGRRIDSERRRSGQNSRCSFPAFLIQPLSGFLVSKFIPSGKYQKTCEPLRRWKDEQAIRVTSLRIAILEHLPRAGSRQGHDPVEARRVCC